MGVLVSKKSSSKQGNEPPQPQQLQATVSPQQEQQPPLTQQPEQQAELETEKKPEQTPLTDEEHEDPEEDEDDEEKEEAEEDETEEEVEKDQTEDLEICDVDDGEEKYEEEKTERQKEILPLTGLSKQLLMGAINVEIPSQVRIVRVFTSSTFTDTFQERNELMVRVYPKLKEYCQSQGYDFQVVDMRWGVRDEATADHMTSELCMKELKACQQLSTGPSFVTFLSHKYGYRPFPPKIVAKEFEMLLSGVSSVEDQNLLKKWFLKDENVVPPTYVLQPITKLLPNYNNHNASQEERSNASGEWWAAFERMQVVFRTAAKKKKLNKQEIEKYFMSVTEDEIQRGIIRANEPSKHTHWFKRNIYDLKENISDKCARNFIDKLGDNLDKEANELVEELKNVKIPSILTKANISVYDIKWQENTGVDPKLSKQHFGYIDLLCRDFYLILKDMIDKGIHERSESDLDDNLLKEICQHATTCQDKSKIFHGREDVLSKIHEYLEVENEINKPLIIHGTSGCGKTSIVAKAASIAKEQFPNRVQVVRFIGTTSDSSTITKLLYTVCCQILRAIGESWEAIPQTYKKLSEYLVKLFDDIQDKHNFNCIIFLDSIDQLAPDDAPFMMKWLPKDLPARVKIVISTLPEEKYQVLPNLKMSTLPEHCFVEVCDLPQDTADTILKSWLQENQRNLTLEQFSAVMNSFQHCPLPLFLKLSFDQAMKWKSYTEVSLCVQSLQKNVKESINTLFTNLERLHGTFLVSHALGLICASKHGLSDAELDDILSIDDEVLNDVYQYWTPPVRRIPPLLWVRLRNDLGSYIIYRGASGVLVNNWYHRQFIETANERYMASPHLNFKYHDLLVQYFSGAWSNGKKKPYVKKSGESDQQKRLVPAQPNVFVDKDSDKETYNYRKLSELPRHLIRINAADVLKKNILFNFGFLSSKLKAFGYRHVLEDCIEASAAFPNDKDIKILQDFLKMSAQILNDPCQLPCQLIGRLYSYNQSEFVTTLLQQARQSQEPGFYPTRQCFDAPGGPLLHSLAGHSGNVNHATFTVDGSKLFSVAEDNTMKLWDMSNGFQLRSYEQEMSINAVFLYQRDMCAILVTYANLIATNLQTEEIYYNEYHSSTYGNSSDIATDRNWFAMSNQSEVLVFDLSKQKPVVQRTITEPAETNQMGFMDVVSCGLKTFAYTRGKDTEFYLADYVNAKFRKVSQCTHPIITFSFTPDGLRIAVLTCPKTETSYKQVFLNIYDGKNGNLLKQFIGKDRHTVTTCYYSNVSVTSIGTVLIWPTIYQINFWNIETGEERHALKTGYQGNTYKQAVCGGGNKLVVVPISQNNSPVQVYDIDVLDFVVIGEEHTKRTDLELARDYVGEGEREMYICNSMDSNLAISVTPMDPILKIWDVSQHVMSKKITHPGLFSIAIMVLDDQRALMWEYNKSSVYLIDMNGGTILCKTKYKKLPIIAPTPYSNTWVYIRTNDELLTLDESQMKFNIFSLKTGQGVATINTGWKHKASHIINSQDGNIIVSTQVNDTDSEVYPLCVYDTSTRKNVSQIKLETKIHLSPENTVLTEDGKFFFAPSEDKSVVNVWNTSTGELCKEIEYKKEDIYSVQIISLSVTSTAGFLVVCYYITVYRDEEYSQELQLVFYDLDTWELITCTLSGGMIYRYCYSHDRTRMMTDIRPGNKDMKTLDLYDISAVKKKKKIKKIASLKLETDARFSYLSNDGKYICLGLAGIDGVTFFQVCGTELVQAEHNDVIEVTVDVESFEQSNV